MLMTASAPERRGGAARLKAIARSGRNAVSRALRLEERKRFRGSFASHADALAAIGPRRLAGYDHDELADVSYEEMCKVHLWDYPVIHWLAKVLDGQANLIDAGGHMGTKFRAFARFIDLPDSFDWAVLDVPAIVRAGRDRASRDGLNSLSFHDETATLPTSDVLLASGLFQYLDASPSQFIAGLPRMPRHFIINKVATREGESVVTLERFPQAEVPYQVRSRVDFEADLASAGYVIRDQWDIPSYSRHHAAFGFATSRGYYAELAG